MKKIIIMSSSLTTGGITSCTINLANKLAECNDVTLAYTNDPDNRIVDFSNKIHFVRYMSPSRNKVIFKMILKGWIKYLFKVKNRNHSSVSPMDAIQRISYVKAQLTKLPIELLDKYDIGVSTSEFYCNDIVATKINAKKKIGWIHPDYKALNIDVNFDKLVLNTFDNIVVVSKSTKDSLINVFPEYESKIEYVPNILNEELIRNMSQEQPKEYHGLEERKKIVTVCRIDNSSKRLDRIIKLALEMKKRQIQFCWFLIGGGVDYDMINSLIKENGLEDVVQMVGEKRNPYPFMRYADVFVLSSQYEGRPIVIDEALLLGCPVIVTDYQSACEQVKSEYGFVIGNNDSTIIDDFFNVLNWNKIDTIKQHIMSIDTLCEIRCAFDEKIKKLFYMHEYDEV